MKNNTRMSSLFGTWTGQYELKASIFGTYKMTVYFVMHVMPDPLRGYGLDGSSNGTSSVCNSTNCNELDNHICTITKPQAGTNTDENNNNGSAETNDDDYYKCVDTETEVVPWSDVSVFFHFGYRVDAGFPYFFHLNHTTGDWIGPYNIVLAQNATSSNHSSTTTTTTTTTFTTTDSIAHDYAKSTPANNKKTLDHYIARYVTTPTTGLLQCRRSNNCTIVPDPNADFDRYAGPSAVDETIRRQTQLHMTTGSMSSSHSSFLSSGGGTSSEDPYEPYAGTCQNGSLEPILPQLELRLVRNLDTKEEVLELDFAYKLLSIPTQKEMEYTVFPALQKRFNHKGDTAFHISGPYCYDDDPKRAYTMDLSFSSVSSSTSKEAYQATDMMSFSKGCIVGYPCLPPGVFVANSTLYSPKFWPGTGAVAVLDTTKTVLSFVCYFLLLALVVSLTCNCQLSSKLGRMQEREDIRMASRARQNTQQQGEDDSPFGDLGNGETGVANSHDDPLSQPLLQSKEDQKPAGTSGFTEHETV